MTRNKLSLPLALLLAAAVSASPALAQGKGNGKGNGNGNGNGRGQKVEQRDDRRDRDDEVRLERRRDDRVERRNSSRTSGSVRRSSTWGGSRWELSGDRRTLSRNGRRVPPGWCIGRGNPHNTPENCGGWRYNQSRSIWDWIGIGGSRDGRTTRDVWSDGRTTRRTSGSGVYSMSHSEYHRWHDNQCRQRTENVSGDARTRLARVLEIRAQCNREHDEWHRRTGVSR